MIIYYHDVERLLVKIPLILQNVMKRVFCFIWVGNWWFAMCQKGIKLCTILRKMELKQWLWILFANRGVVNMSLFWGTYFERTFVHELLAKQPLGHLGKHWPEFRWNYDFWTIELILHQLLWKTLHDFKYINFLSFCFLIENCFPHPNKNEQKLKKKTFTIATKSN